MLSRENMRWKGSTSICVYKSISRVDDVIFRGASTPACMLQGGSRTRHSQMRMISMDQVSISAFRASQNREPTCQNLVKAPSTPSGGAFALLGIFSSSGVRLGESRSMTVHSSSTGIHSKIELMYTSNIKIPQTIVQYDVVI